MKSAASNGSAAIRRAKSAEEEGQIRGSIARQARPV